MSAPAPSITFIHMNVNIVGKSIIFTAYQNQIHTNAMISIIHPSRGRPEQALKTAQKWIELAGCPIEWWLSLDEDDRDHYENIPDNTLFLVNKNRSAIDAINNAAIVSRGDILIQIADDFDCPPDWGKQIIETTKGKTDWILKTPDGIQPWIITLPIMDRAYYNRFGYIYHPGYRHMFCDTEMSCVADLTGRRITANIPFKHNHYSVGGAVKDAISERADKTWEQGEKLFLSRYRQNFGLIDTPGRIQDQGMLNWIKSKGI